MAYCLSNSRASSKAILRLFNNSSRVASWHNAWDFFNPADPTRAILLYHGGVYVVHARSPKLFRISKQDLDDPLLRAHQKSVRERRQWVRGDDGSLSRVVYQIVCDTPLDIIRRYPPVHQREDSPVARDTKLHEDVLWCARVIQHRRIVVAAQYRLNEPPIRRTSRHSVLAQIGPRTEADTSGH